MFESKLHTYQLCDLGQTLSSFPHEKWGLNVITQLKIYKCAWFIVKDPKGDVPNDSYLYTQWQVLAHVDSKKNG